MQELCAKTCRFCDSNSSRLSDGNLGSESEDEDPVPHFTDSEPSTDSDSDGEILHHREIDEVRLHSRAPAY